MIIRCSHSWEIFIPVWFIFVFLCQSDYCILNMKLFTWDEIMTAIWNSQLSPSQHMKEVHWRLTTQLTSKMSFQWQLACGLILYSCLRLYAGMIYSIKNGGIFFIFSSPWKDCVTLVVSHWNSKYCFLSYSTITCKNRDVHMHDCRFNPMLIHIWILFYQQIHTVRGPDKHESLV